MLKHAHEGNHHPAVVKTYAWLFFTGTACDNILDSLLEHDQMAKS